MKKLVYILLSLTFLTCEDIIELDLKTAEPRLVIDASLNWIKETSGNTQYIRLSLTTPYYNTSISPATGASVIVTDTKNNSFIFDEEENTGIYKNQSFIPEINGVYKLKIQYNNEVYIATETLIAVVPIDSVEQKNDGGFSGEETEIKAYYFDPKNVENYYFFEFINTDSKIISLEVYDDEFTDGNKIFAFHSDENLKAGNELIIQNHGISKRYYEYMNLLLQQSNDESGGPFETQPATLRGNCLNQTNPDNYPLGYFRVSEVAVFKYIIE